MTIKVGVRKVKNDSYCINQWRYNVILDSLQDDDFAVSEYKTNESFDVIVAPLTDIGLRELFQMRKAGRLIGDVTDDITSWPFENYNLIGKFFYLFRFYGSILPTRIFKLLVCHSIVVGSVAQYQRFSFFKKNIYVVTDAITPDLLSVKKVTSNVCDEIKIGWIGTVQAIYGLVEIKDILEIISRKIKCKFIFITSDKKHGKFLGKKPNDIYNLMNSLNINSEFVPWTYSESAKALAQCDLTIIPVAGNSKFSQSKPLGRLLYSMALGLPAVVSPISSYFEFLAAHPGLSCIATNKEEWFYHIINLARNEDLRKAMGDESKKTVKELFGIDNFLSKYKEAIFLTLESSHISSEVY